MKFKYGLIFYPMCEKCKSFSLSYAQLKNKRLHFESVYFVKKHIAWMNYTLVENIKVTSIKAHTTRMIL